MRVTRSTVPASLQRQGAACGPRWCDPWPTPSCHNHSMARHCGTAWHPCALPPQSGSACVSEFPPECCQQGLPQRRWAERCRCRRSPDSSPAGRCADPQPPRSDLRKGAKSVPRADRAIGNLQQWLIGTDHGVRREQIQVYLDEFVFRHNRRHLPMAAFRTLLGLGTWRKSTHYEQIRGAIDFRGPDPKLLESAETTG